VINRFIAAIDVAEFVNKQVLYGHRDQKVFVVVETVSKKLIYKK